MAAPVILCFDGWPHHNGPAELFRSIREYSPKTQFIATPIKESGRELELYYVNHSPNPAWFELACLRRWFALLDTCVSMGIKSAWSLDWDCLVFDDLEKSEIPGTGITCLPDSYIEDVSLLDQFCRFMLEFYRAKGSVYEKLVGEFTAGKRNSINDITIYQAWAAQENRNAHNFCFIRDGSAFDANLALGSYGFASENGSKIIEWRSGVPYAKTDDGSWARLKLLHCWGSHKTRMAEYLNAGLASRNA